MRIRICLVWFAALCLALTGTAVAQGPEGWQPTYLDEPGVCDGTICGPSGAVIFDTFPTIAEIDWDAFPTNPRRPYEPAPGGRVWYVAPGGNDAADGTAEAPFGTLDRAVELAHSGDVILLADGEYPVGLRDDTIYLDTPGVTLAAEHIGGAVLVPRDPEWAWLSGITARADDLVIDGLVIRGFTRGYGVYFGRLDSPQRNLVLRHLRIENTSDGIRSVIPDSGVPNSQPVIAGLLLYDVALRDVEVVGFNCGEGPCNDVRIEALSVIMPGTGAGSGADAVAFESGDNVVILNADVSGAAADGIDLKVTRAAVANVIVHDLGRNGIKLWYSGDIINALVYNTGADAAIVFHWGGNDRILNSVVAHHSPDASAYAGTVAYDESDEPGALAVINSIFYQNSGPLWVSGAFTLDVRATLFYGSRNGQELIWALPQEVSVGEQDQPFAALEAVGGGCCGFDFVDPGFVNPDAGDYHLAPGAFARDRGLADVDALPPFDLLGRLRVAGAGIDLGPYEE